MWGPAHVEDTQYLRVYIGQLRQKIEAEPDDPKVILTEPGNWLPDCRGVADEGGIDRLQFDQNGHPEIG